jgi:GntR family transcriptional regulator
MLFPLDPTSPVPVETQLVGAVRAAIEAGLLGPGDALPTVRQLAVELRVNANAVDRAYAELGRQGLLELDPGAGARVRRGPSGGEAELGTRLVALEDEFLARAAELGFGLDEVIIHLDARRTR